MIGHYQRCGTLFLVNGIVLFSVGFHYDGRECEVKELRKFSECATQPSGTTIGWNNLRGSFFVKTAEFIAGKKSPAVQKFFILLSIDIRL